MSDNIQHLLKQASFLKEEAASSVTFARRVFPSASVTGDFFDRIKEKLFYIENWKTHPAMCNFELFDESGNLTHEKTLSVSDFIRITLPGSGKDDWVKITDIHQSENEFVITVQPSYNPTEAAPDKSVTSHFFIGESTNNFCLQKEEKTVSLYVIGLNEKSNTGDTANVIETVRNFATANLGYYLGIQKNEWKTFCENLLEIKESEKSEE
jgi:hypothetical protein